MEKTKKFLFYLAWATLLWSGIFPKDYLTWFLEAVPALIGLPILYYVDSRHRVSSALYILVCLHAIILCVGAKYTYAEVPAGFWMSEAMGWSRNHYDRLGHFFQGFQPAIFCRELLIRNYVIQRRGGWTFLICVMASLSFSAFYELIEFGAALLSSEAAEAFLGTQGDVWDTQWDMLFALIGSLCSLFFLSDVHDKQINTLQWR
ncbi:MAG: DUF2238 domain-containing protein [Bdellovibrionales bacterium]|nr:DUF2238 domain-containing protein [Bdellovibrionales bacterium]